MALLTLCCVRLVERLVILKACLSLRVFANLVTKLGQSARFICTWRCCHIFLRRVSLRQSRPSTLWRSWWATVFALTSCFAVRIARSPRKSARKSRGSVMCLTRMLFPPLMCPLSTKCRWHTMRKVWISKWWSHLALRMCLILIYQFGRTLLHVSKRQRAKLRLRLSGNIQTSLIVISHWTKRLFTAVLRIMFRWNWSLSKRKFLKMKIWPSICTAFTVFLSLVDLASVALKVKLKPFNTHVRKTFHGSVFALVCKWLWLNLLVIYVALKARAHLSLVMWKCQSLVWWPSGDARTKLRSAILRQIKAAQCALVHIQPALWKDRMLRKFTAEQRFQNVTVTVTRLILRIKINWKSRA